MSLFPPALQRTGTRTLAAVDSATSTVTATMQMAEHLAAAGASNANRFRRTTELANELSFDEQHSIAVDKAKARIADHKLSIQRKGEADPEWKELFDSIEFTPSSPELSVAAE